MARLARLAAINILYFSIFPQIKSSTAVRVANDLNSFEFLDTDKVVVSLDGHGVDHLVVAVHLPDRPGALLSLLLGSLDGDDLSLLESHQGSHLPAVRSCLLELFTKLERRGCSSRLVSVLALSLTLNFSSIDLRVVEVLMVQTPSASDTSRVGVEIVAAFLSR